VFFRLESPLKYLEKPMRKSIFMQLLFNRLLKSSNPIELAIILRIRRLMARHYDPLVVYKLAGTEIMLPFSHQLPLLRKSYPGYSSNVARVAKHVKQKYPSFSFIDIGSNIGDTAVILRELAYFPILCIEGDRGFYQILKHNVREFDEIYIENFFITTDNMVKGKLEKRHGTARFVKGSVNSIDNQKTLSEILQRYDTLSQNVKMIKIDTDGFDVRILRTELKILGEFKPVLFFEYDPHLLSQHESDNGIGVFNALSSIGYTTAIFYDNFGDYLLTTDLSNEFLIEDIHNYYSGRSSSRYCDIALFHSDDTELSRNIRCAELEFFRTHRNVLVQPEQ